MKTILAISTLLLVTVGFYFWKHNEIKLKEKLGIERELSKRIEEERLEKKRLDGERLEKQAMQDELARLKKIADKRAAAREAASGIKMDELQTTDGRIYKNITIKEATAVGLAFQHSDGSARVNYEKLPKSLQERFYYDPNETAAALVKEREQIQEYEKMLNELEKKNSITTADQKATAAKEQKKQLIRDLELADTNISNLNQKLSNLRRELSDDLERAYRSQRDSRLGGISRAPIIREQISDTEEQLNTHQLRRAAISAKLKSE